MATTARLVPLEDLRLRARVDSAGKILGFVDLNGNAVMLAVADASGQIGSSEGVPTTYDVIGLPTNSVAPAITGDGTVGVELTASTGTWAGEDITYTYQWKLDGVAIALATAAAYTPLVGQVDSDLTVTVTATNTAGAVSATSTATTVIEA